MAEPRDDVGDLLADGGRARGLAVRAAEHRHVREAVRHRGQRVADAVERGQQHVLARRLQHQAVAGVVDVLAGAREVHEFGGLGELRVAGEAFLDEIFDRLDVVVGRALDGLDARCVVDGEICGDGKELRLRLRRERRGFGNLVRLRECEQPVHLDQHAAPHQAVLAEDRA